MARSAGEALGAALAGGAPRGTILELVGTILPVIFGGIFGAMQVDDALPLTAVPRVESERALLIIDMATELQVERFKL